MLGNKRTITLVGYYFGAIAFLTLLVFLVAFDNPLNTIVIRPHFDAENSGVVTVYVPKANGTYTERRMSSAKFPQGVCTPSLVISTYAIKHPLRFDPLMGKGRVLLVDVTFERFGITKKIEAKELASLLVKSVDVTWQLSDKGLEIISNSIDPQLYFQLSKVAFPVPPLSTILTTLAFFLVNLTLLLFLSRKWFLSPPRSTQFTLSVGPFVLALLSWLFQWPPFLAITSCTLLAVAIQHSFASLAFSTQKPKSVPLLSLNIEAFIIVSCFLFLIFIPIARTLYPKNDFIDLSKQVLVDFTENNQRNWQQSYINLTKGIENNLIQCFSFRTELIHLNANVKIFGFGYSASPKAILGKNGMFFEGYGEQRVERDVTAHFDNVTDYMGLIPYTNEELEVWRVTLEERYYWLKEKGIDYIFALAPSKAQVYQENLPSRILATKRILNRPSRYDQLVAYMKQHSPVPFVDLATPLRNVKLRLEEQNQLASTPLYYRTDFHWTYYGAYIAYRAIVDEVNRNYPQYQLVPVPLDDFSIKVRPDWVHAPFINLLGLDPLRHRNEAYLTFYPRSGTLLADITEFGTKGINDYTLPDPVYQTFDGNVVGTREISNNSGHNDTIFVIGDSFSEKFFGFFSAHAKRTINFRTVYSFYSEPFEKLRPKLVIQEVLNMYLLQPPPTNTLPVQKARERAMAQKQTSAGF